tara:strand:+ start:1466 stop:2260 length:795 start_codon:yes stop_codon:yes gene_type:complete
LINSDSIWFHWHGHIEVVLGLGFLQLAYLYFTGPYRKKKYPEIPKSPYRNLLFTLGNLMIFLSISSPIHVLSDDFLFSVHMFQHIVITLLSPPLLILGTPSWLISPIFNIKITLKIFKIIFHPLITVIFFNFIFSVWHLPVLYELSVKFHWIHVFEHVLFMLAAIMMWWPLCSQIKQIPQLPYPLQMIYLFVMSLAQIIVFGIVTFARQPIYQHYIQAERIFGISPLLDQQIGGIIMKVGSGFMFLFLIVLAFYKWYDQETNKK